MSKKAAGPRPSAKLSIAIANRQRQVKVDRRRLTRAVSAILADAGIRQAELSIAIVDDATIHQVNRQFLNHDYPTDVISFVLEAGEDWLEGEIVASADTASAFASKLGWPAGDELLLYVIHGTLHLVGHDDHSAAGRRKMRRAERQYLALFDLVPPKPPARAAKKPRR